MLTNEAWYITHLREDHILREDRGVLNEGLTFFGTSEIVECILVEHTQFWSMRALNELFVLTPCYRAVVTVLTERLLHDNSVAVHAFHDAWACLALLTFREEEVTRESEAGANSFLKSIECNRFNKPI